MAFVIINGEWYLSSFGDGPATVLAERYEAGWPIAAGFALCGGRLNLWLFPWLFVAYTGIPSLIVTLGASPLVYCGVAVYPVRRDLLLFLIGLRH